MTGLIFDPAAFTALSIGGGLQITNLGAGPRTKGRRVVLFYNTDEYGGDDLVVTPAVTATLVDTGEEIEAVPATITIPPGQMAIVGPFGLEHQDEEGKVDFTFTGQEGSYYVFELS